MKTSIAIGLGLIASAAQAQNGPADPAVNETFKFAKPAGQPDAIETSPDGQITVQVSTDNDGRAVYMIARNGKAIVEPSRLGMMFTDAPKIERGLKIESVAHAKSDTSWTQPWGEWQHFRLAFEAQGRTS